MIENSNAENRNAEVKTGDAGRGDAAEGATVEVKARGDAGRGDAAEGATVEVKARGDAGRGERVRARRNFLIQYGGSLVLVPITLATGHARELYRQYYDVISRQYYFAWYYGNFQGQKGNYIAVSREISKGIQATTDELKRRSAISKELLAKNKVKTVPSTHLGQVNYEAKVVTPHSKLFLDALVEADELVVDVKSLWQACLINDEQVNHANNDVSRLIRNLYASARLISNGIRDRSMGRSSRTEAEAIAAESGYLDPGAISVTEEGRITAVPEPDKADAAEEMSDRVRERKAA